MNEERTGKCLWQVEHICGHLWHNGQPSHGGDCKIFKVMASTLPKGIIGSVSSLLAEIVCPGQNNNRNTNIWPDFCFWLTNQNTFNGGYFKHLNDLESSINFFPHNFEFSIETLFITWSLVLRLFTSSIIIKVKG